MPKEGGYDYADVAVLAGEVSARFGFLALTHSLIDSDVLVMCAFRAGARVHRYVSRQEMLGNTIEEDDGTFVCELDGVVYRDWDAVPTGPVGADAQMLALFGVGAVDHQRLGAALRGDHGSDRPSDAGSRHHAILEALNLDPRGLTIAFRWAVSAGRPGAVRIRPPADDGTLLLPFMVFTVVPADVDPADAAQVLVDAARELPWPVRVAVGYTPAVPGAATGPDIVPGWIPVYEGQRVAVFFAGLGLREDSRPTADEVHTAADQAWATAWRDRYGIGGEQEPLVATLSVDRFEIGFKAASVYRSNHPGG